MKIFKSNSEIIDVVEFVEDENFRTLSEEDNIDIRFQHLCTECGTIHRKDQACPECGLNYNITRG